MICYNALGESHCETAFGADAGGGSNSPMRTSKSEEQSREERRRRECECEVRMCSSQCVQRCVCAWSVEAVIGVCLVFGVEVCGCGVCCV